MVESFCACSVRHPSSRIQSLRLCVITRYGLDVSVLSISSSLSGAFSLRSHGDQRPIWSSCSGQGVNTTITCAQCSNRIVGSPESKFLRGLPRSNWLSRARSFFACPRTELLSLSDGGRRHGFEVLGVERHQKRHGRPEGSEPSSVRRGYGRTGVVSSYSWTSRTEKSILSPCHRLHKAPWPAAYTYYTMVHPRNPLATYFASNIISAALCQAVMPP